MSAIPQPVADALNALQADADAVTAAAAAKSATAAQLATDQAADAAAGTALTAAQAHEATDLSAFLALVQSTYGPNATPPPTSPAAPTPASS